ncbi:MAG: hypothetical protein Q8S03_07345 [Brevundimonas sp.]|uniref:hypothetical protein n=1 Tax=Brevundimonas sp. TaxID=1871086 RepID=UPI002733370C|nr:hypothetical protein [Brevundimonas sp.]MDP3404488.1 hypothetical protein [Brevundimonas sp.]
MTEPPESSVPNPPVAPVATVKTPEQIAKVERTRRLASALRDNLRRRKAVRPGTGRPDN